MKIKDIEKYANNWVMGRIGKYSFEAKVLKDNSPKGIDQGKISKICIWESKKKRSQIITHYDLKWDIEPKTDEHKKLLQDIIKHFK